MYWQMFIFPIVFPTPRNLIRADRCLLTRPRLSAWNSESRNARQTLFLRGFLRLFSLPRPWRLYLFFFSFAFSSVVIFIFSLSWAERDGFLPIGAPASLSKKQPHRRCVLDTLGNRWKIHLCVCCCCSFRYFFLFFWLGYYKIWARHDIPIFR